MTCPTPRVVTHFGENIEQRDNRTAGSSRSSARILCRTKKHPRSRLARRAAGVLMFDRRRRGRPTRELPFWCKMTKSGDDRDLEDSAKPYSVEYITLRGKSKREKVLFGCREAAT